MTTIGIDVRVLATGRTSGIEEYTERLLAHLLPLDRRVQFRLFCSGRTPLAYRPWFDLSNVSLTVSRWPNRLLLASVRLVGRPYLDRMVGGADVFFFPHFLLGPTSPVCKRVMTWHDLSYERMPELFSVQRRLWHHAQMQPRKQAQCANRIIAVSESTRRDLIDLYGISGQRITTVLSGIDATLVRADDAAIGDLRRQHGLSGRFILALGTLEPRKNLEALIGAFELLARRDDMRDTQLVLAGPDGWLSDGIKRRAQTSVVRERIIQTGPIPAAQRAAWYSAASVVAYPSLLEGFGFPPLEAMACGTPAVVGANSSMAQLCGDAALSVNPYSVEQLAHALDALLGDERLRETMIQRGTALVRPLSWQRTAQQTLETLLSAA